MSFEGVATGNSSEKTEHNKYERSRNQFQLLCKEIQAYKSEIDKLQLELEDIRQKSGGVAVLRNKLERTEEKMNQILKVGKKLSRLEGVNFNPGDSIMSRHDFCLMLGRTDAHGVKKPIAYNTMIRFVEQNPDGYEIIKMGSGRHGLTFVRIKAQLKVA